METSAEGIAATRVALQHVFDGPEYFLFDPAPVLDDATEAASSGDIPERLFSLLSFRLSPSPGCPRSPRDLGESR